MRDLPFSKNFLTQNQAHLSLVSVFHESVAYERNYTLPFNMISICIRNEGTDSSVSTNLRTGQVHKRRENDIILIPYNLPNHFHHTLRSERYGIHFKMELYPGIDVYSGVEEQIIENSPELREEAEEIFADRDSTRMMMRCSDFALRFCLRHWPEQYGYDAKKVKIFEPLLIEIQNNISAQLRVSDLAKKMNMSERNFNRLFQDVFHKSPKQYLMELLFEKASMMLQSPDENVKSIANKLSFRNEFYFSRFFKRLSGTAPHDFQKEISNFV